ncbi:NADH-quinone oxidoreductase subunit C [Streptomyces xiamenensis]|uniref:NADH-quinone oxidoreductase subunit C n=1 Tax=Streptomyces xiamenensis TaxID=408015 RepID=UPI00343B2212
MTSEESGEAGKSGEFGEFGEGATESVAYGLRTVDVPADRWLAALTIARDGLGCTFFDWLSAVDEGADGFRVCAHVVALGAPPRGVLIRTLVGRETPALPSATEVYAGAAWHERETREMFGVDFPGHPGLAPLLLPDSFEGHPLRKDFVLAARVAKAWPGAKEPGESGHGAPKRRQTLPPGVPDPNEWGPQKGQLPPAPTRPARGPRRGPAPDGEEGAAARPPRRTRTAGGGSASQRPDAGDGPGEGGTAPQAPRPPRRSRSASGGSASQREPEATEGPAADAPPPEAPRGPRRSRSASDGSASQREPDAPQGPAAASPDSGLGGGSTTRRGAARGGDAPWHNPEPAFPDTPRSSPDDSREDPATPAPDDGGRAPETADGTEPPRARGGGQDSARRARTSSGPEQQEQEQENRNRDEEGDG